MLTYRHVVTYGATDQIWLSALSDLQIASVGGQDLLIAANLYYGKGITSYRFGSADIPLIAVDQQAYLAGFGYLGAPRLTMITVNGQSHVSLTHLGGAEGLGLSLDSGGDLGGFAGLVDDLGAKLTALGQFQLGASSYLFSATKGSLGFVVDKLQGDGSLTRITQVQIPDSGYLAGSSIDRMVELASGGQKFLIAVSSLGDFVSTHPILAGGQIGTGTLHSGLLGAGYAVPTQVAVLETGGRSFVVLGASASSSLTVFHLMPDGRLQNTDHVIDELTTRFQSITALDAVTVAGRAYIFAGGVDGGISVFTLQPDGRLLHLDTIVDTNAMTLSRIADIEAKVIGGKIALFVASSSEVGITQLSFDPGNVGTTGLAPIGAPTGSAADDLLLAQSGTYWMHGGDGDDILIATSDSIAMFGGAGADVFVPANFEGRVAIKDYEVGKDRLDLSQLDMIRSIWQLTFVPQSYGIKIYYHKAVIDIFTSDGRSLTKDDFSNALFPITHYDLPEVDPTTIGDDDLPSTQGKFLFGGDGDDTLMGGGGSDSITAGAGNDMISAMGGDDTVRGEEGDDRIRGQDGDDWLYGEAGMDSLFGDEGNDRLYGGDGVDQLWGDDGNDRLYGEAGDDRLWGGRGNDSLWGGQGRDLLYGEDGADRLFGSDGNDTLHGGNGNDYLDGGPGDDTLFGNSGNDQLIDYHGTNRLYGGFGHDTIRSGAGADHIDGGGGDDRIYGGGGSDRIIGGDGNDHIWGQGGNDRIEDYSGNNRIYGNGGHDRLFTGAGHDLINAGWGNDYVAAGSGNDRLFGNAGHDTLNGNQGNDQLSDLSGNNRLFGGFGHDTLKSGTGKDLLRGGPGHDRLYAGAAADSLYGEDGNDFLWGEAGDDRLFGGNGNDRLYGGGGRDRLSGNLGNDLLVDYNHDNWFDGGWGADTIKAGGGRDTLLGNLGNDRLFSGGGADRLAGGGGHDRLYGGNGNDTLWGNLGDDLLQGGGGADLLIGGGGNDTLHGGAGRDVFRFQQQSDSRRYDADLILDFTPGQDLIDLTALDLTFRGRNGFSGADQLRWQYVGQETRIFIELDNDGAAEMMIRLNERLHLDGEDFLL
ncbi:calcium-binding protein [Paracoccus homiensis]|uniref:Ca2+-binding protein, RTX toxin-related n=1 Tax=Paracoccus homiensis TaxID=364199 RepID=A0A1I0AF46_9RHOB|nr:calcium-binding protein [Paracoccus homiensis]SES92440.1 Ca2+-binding protein, RTX toxin-related [Paracoccus homiensis]